MSSKVNVKRLQINSALYYCWGSEANSYAFPNNCCDLDPLPNVLLKVLLYGTSTNIVNVSLRIGISPDDFKQAMTSPFLNSQLCCMITWKIIDLSNLSFISKIFEKGVTDHLGFHIKSNVPNCIVKTSFYGDWSPKSAQWCHLKNG